MTQARQGPGPRPHVQQTGSPTMAQARAYLVEAMRAAEATGRLPSLSAMAAASSFGRVSLWRVVRALVAEGRLEAAPGRGIRLAASARALAAPSRPSPMWQQTRDRLLADAQSGTYGRGTKLPIAKELAGRYGTSGRIVRQALWALEQAGVLRRERHGFRVATVERGTTDGQVVVISVTRTVEMLLRQSPRAPEFWRALERGTRRMGTTLRIVAYHSAVGAQRYPYFPYRDIVAYDHRRMVLGYLVLAFGLEPAWLTQVLGLLRQTNKPVAVMDELGEAPVEQAMAAAGRNPHLRAFRVGTTESAGAAVGRYLAAAGHRKVACISVAPSQPWSSQRVAGLSSVYAALGLDGAVTQFGLPAEGATAVEQAVPQRLLKPMLHAFVHLQEHLHDARDRLPSDVLRDLLAAEYQRSRLTAVYDRVREQAPDATAWVGTNDAAVLPALPYLHARGILVPRDISLVGMDDTVEASADGLSSYSFSAPAVAEAMLEHVAGWSASRGRRAGRPVVEVPGVVVERTSSGPPGASLSRL